MLLVEFVLGELEPGLEVELVAAEEDARAVLLQTVIGKAGDLFDGLGRVLGREGRQRIQSLAELRQPHGDDGNAVHAGIHLLEIAHRAFERLSVVQPRAADDLTVHHDPASGEAAHDPDALPRAGIAQHFAAQRGISGVHRDVDRTDVQVDDALNLSLREIGERDVVAQKKAKTRVVVFEIHRRAHAGRQLVDEAENTVVGAGARAVHQIALELQPQVAALGLSHADAVLRAVGAPQHDRKRAVVSEKLIVEHIDDPIAVDRHQAFADLRFPPQRTCGIDRLDAVFRLVRLPSPLMQNEERSPSPRFTKSYLLSSTLMTVRPLYCPQALHA